MSFPIWTPAELSSEFKSYAHECWRLVEAQYLIATLPLVDSLDEQRVLEDLIDKTKPIVPPEFRNLHYLLATPFRYPPPKHGSRFRREGQTQGVFYAAEEVETAVAEIAFYKLLFFSESPQTPLPQKALEHTAFSVRIASGRSLDLSARPFSSAEKLWTDPVHYEPCQNFADLAREAHADLLRFLSVRDPLARANVAVFNPEAFASPPLGSQTWHVHVFRKSVVALREFPHAHLEFPFGQFARDPRVASLIAAWESHPPSR